jgi:coenzyme F420 hydrogenase subunit beta
MHITSDRAASVFARLEAEVIRTGLCTHCGTCAGLSGGQVAMQATAQGPLPRAVSGPAPMLPPAAYDACPGKGLNYPQLCDAVFGQQPANWLIGVQRGLFVGYAVDDAIRRGGASGGVITQTLIYLLQEGLIDGAVVVQQGRPQPWQAEPVIARSVDDIRAASQSVYVPVPVNTLLPQMDAFEGRLAYVGLPDQVAALRRLQQLGHPGAQKVQYVLGPYVGTIMYFGAIESYLRAQGGHRVDDIARLRYREGEWPGHLQIDLRSGESLQVPKFYYNYLIPFYITRSTLHAVDFTNELTDISVGDAWHPRYEGRGEGFSLVVGRSATGLDVLRAMQDKHLLRLDPIAEDEALGMHGHMLDFKKRGAFIRLGWRRKLGRPVPDYGYRPAKIPLSRYAVEMVISAIFLAGSTRLARRVVQFVPVAILGPLFNTLRKSWKRMSKPTKRKGLQETEFTTTSAEPAAPGHKVTGALWAGLQAVWRALRVTMQELRHWTRSTWSFDDVAAHWDSVQDYDDINEETYSYFRRFVDGLRLSNIPDGAHILDLCARTGNGTLYFHEHGKVGSVVCADVSTFQGEICRQRLEQGGVEDFEWVHFHDYTLPFEDGTFAAVLNFETLEHFPEPALMVMELARVTKPGGTLVITTPNVLWEPVHALAAIFGLHHSEGPHRFIRYHRLLDMIRHAGLRIEAAETTVLVPGGPDGLVRFGEWVEQRTRHTLMPLLGLRRVIVCRKP